ncbi:reverse transcriptase domain-containing protein, partial [Mycobacterium kansasii]
MTTRGNQTISHLLYTDDTILFTNGSNRVLTKLLNFLNKFLTTSGLKINKRKSTLVLPSKMSEARIRAIERL